MDQREHSSCRAICHRVPDKLFLPVKHKGSALPELLGDRAKFVILLGGASVVRQASWLLDKK